MTAYAAGLRVSEVVRLQLRDIESDPSRMDKDRVVLPYDGKDALRFTFGTKRAGYRCALEPPNHSISWNVARFTSV